MVSIIIRPKKDYNKGVGIDAIVGWELVVVSEDLEMLEALKEEIQTMFIRCDICKGEVTKSGDKYLCLGGCGIVDGEKNISIKCPTCNGSYSSNEKLNKHIKKEHSEGNKDE